MGEYYHTLFSGGDRCTDNRRMYVMLYPNSVSVNDNYVKDSSSAINQALQSAGDQLVSHGATNFYQIERFHAETYNYPV